MSARGGAARPGYSGRLARNYLLYTAGFAAFVVGIAFLEQLGLPRATIGYIFLAATILVYAGIGIAARTNDPADYYVAGRRVPAVFNGMATGADWMSAASFISLAGGLYARGYSGLAFIMGWTGGYVLVGLLLAPYLRKFGQYTIPDFLAARYGGDIPRLVGVVVTVACSFTYVVAQIYGIGLITTRLTGVEFQVGIFLALAGMLVCSFLGGMRAVTWTQVAQYIIMVIAYLIPVVWLSWQQTGSVLPQAVYGAQLLRVTELEAQLLEDPIEAEVRALFRRRSADAAEKLRDPEAALAAERRAAARAVLSARAAGAPEAIRAAEEALLALPTDVSVAHQAWQAEVAMAAQAGPLVRHGEPHPGQDEVQRNLARRNFLALVFCLMVGTAALPHVLVRYYTTPSVKSARRSVGWSLLFILVIYLTAPALAVLVKYVILSDVIGASYADLPGWIRQWQRVDPNVLSLIDINGDGRVQHAELRIGEDIIVLATPEIAGLPYVISGLVAAGGLAAALSTADGLLLTIANALSHDAYHRIVDPRAPAAQRVLVSKILVLVVAAIAALVAAQRPGDILFMVGATFSLAAASFFPALVLGIFWKRTTGLAAVAGMLAGAAVTFYYMTRTQPWLREVFHGVPRALPVTEHWWGIDPISAGVFGVPVGFAMMIVLSLLTPVPAEPTRRMVDEIRFPRVGSGR